jgi:DinB family protein
MLVLFRQVHQQLRDALDGLDQEALNWVPLPGANSIATIVRHLLGSEAEALRSVAGVTCERDRDAEFVGRRLSRDDVLGMLEQSDRLIAELEPGIDQGRLTAEIPLPTCPPEEVRPGLTWLIGTYGHSREHVGQIQISIQLLDGRG